MLVNVKVTGGLSARSVRLYLDIYRKGCVLA